MGKALNILKIFGVSMVFAFAILWGSGVLKDWGLGPVEALLLIVEPLIVYPFLLIVLGAIVTIGYLSDKWGT